MVYVGPEEGYCSVGLAGAVWVGLEKGWFRMVKNHNSILPE
jgi:hypothetical protein